MKIIKTLMVLTIHLSLLFTMTAYGQSECWDSANAKRDSCVTSIFFRHLVDYDIWGNFDPIDFTNDVEQSCDVQWERDTDNCQPYEHTDEELKELVPTIIPRP